MNLKSPRSFFQKKVLLEANVKKKLNFLKLYLMNTIIKYLSVPLMIDFSAKLLFQRTRVYLP